MKLWVDDIRDAPEGWTRAETISEAISILRMFGMPSGFSKDSERITHVSLDHDISIPVKVNGVWYNRPSLDTFRVVALYMAEMFCSETGGLMDDVVVTTHSSNPEGRKRIVAVFEEIGVECEETPAEQVLRDNNNRL